MKKLTLDSRISLSPKFVEALEEACEKYNEWNGTKLTNEEFMQKGCTDEGVRLLLLGYFDKKLPKV